MEHGVFLCMANFICGLLGLAPYFLYSKVRRGQAIPHLVIELLQCELKYLIGITLLGCMANISTMFIYSLTSIHSVQTLRCASPIFAGAVSILTQEDTPSWRLLFSLSFIVIGLVFSVYKVRKRIFVIRDSTNEITQFSLQIPGQRIYDAIFEHWYDNKCYDRFQECRH